MACPLCEPPAAPLCDQAGDGEIPLSQRALAAIEDLVEAEPVGDLTLSTSPEVWAVDAS